jgi:UDP-N-acetylmuramoyl-L-alanyl-D-glutamate--2,6-diaminopimelate ligase
MAKGLTIDKIVKNINTEQLIQSHEHKIKNIAFDSRKVTKDSLFVAVKGTISDGHKFIDTAIESGANTIVCEVLPSILNPKVAYLQVKDCNLTLGDLATLYFDNPSNKLKLIGITGTNGKTTTSMLMYDLFKSLGYKVGLISTIEYRIDEKIIPSTHTTPDPMKLNELLANMVDAGCDYVFMEVSSHAIDQERIRGLKFKVAIFSNITRDHLDYHLTFDNYIAAKKKFFDQLQPDAISIINVDDANGKIMVQNTKSTIKTIGIKKNADFKVKILENLLSGLHLTINGKELIVRLIGEFNAYNIVTAFATAIVLGQNEEEVLSQLSSLKAAEGRFDYVWVNGMIGIVDYAHTPDALKNVLETIKQLKGGGKVITVVGCGGDRDKGKRPIMAKIAFELSDKVILTSDNPRTENADQIIKDMEEGIPIPFKNKTLSIVDRTQAIKAAAQFALKGDIILVAGKGHEKYQEINGIKTPFDDKVILNEVLQRI